MKRAGYNVKINGKEYVVSVVETTGGAAISPIVAAQPQSAPVAAPIAKKDVPTDGNKVVAPMPGTVLSVKKDGVAVKKGDAILVLEAMKMENEIAAPCDGLVNVTVSIGSKVNSGDVLAVIK